MTSGIDHFEISRDGDAFASVGMAMSHNFTGLANGTHNVTVGAIDAAGNKINQNILFTITVKTSVSGAETSGDLMLYSAIVAIIVVIIVAAIVIMMRKKKSPSMERLDEMKPEPPTIPDI